MLVIDAWFSNFSFLALGTKNSKKKNLKNVFLSKLLPCCGSVPHQPEKSRHFLGGVVRVVYGTLSLAWATLKVI